MRSSSGAGGIGVFLLPRGWVCLEVAPVTLTACRGWKPEYTVGPFQDAHGHLCRGVPSLQMVNLPPKRSEFLLSFSLVPVGNSPTCGILGFHLFSDLFASVLKIPRAAECRLLGSGTTSSL